MSDIIDLTQGKRQTLYAVLLYINVVAAAVIKLLLRCWREMFHFYFPVNIVKLLSVFNTFWQTSTWWICNKTAAVFSTSWWIFL